MKQGLYLLIFMIILCQCKSGVDKKKEILSSIYIDDGIIETTQCKFDMYSDSTYEFTVHEFSEYRHEKNEIFRGRYIMKGDTVNFFPFQFYFLSTDKAILKNNYLEFLDGDYPFKMKVLRTSLSQKIYIDTLRFNDYAFFTYDSSFYKNFTGNIIPYDLDTNDLIKIDSLLASCINSNHITMKLGNYFKQCIAVKDIDNEIIVWVNMLCKGKSYNNLFYNIDRVNDGGDCFFNLKINLNKLIYYELYINGEA